MKLWIEFYWWEQPGFTYCACGPFTKNEERIEKFMQTGNTNFIYQVNLIKLVFNMIWLMANQRTQAKKEKKEIKRTQAKRAQADKDLKHKTFKTASNPKYDGYRRGLASMVYNFFDKKSALLNKSSGSGIVNEPNCQLANELHKPIIRKLKKRKVYSSFRDNIRGVDLADMQSLSKYNKGRKVFIVCNWFV